MNPTTCAWGMNSTKCARTSAILSPIVPRETHHGPLTDRITQLWVKITGKKTHLETHPWLAGITAKPAGIGAGFFNQFAQEQGLIVEPGVGLVEKIQSLAGEECHPETLHPSVIEFYER